ncbi:MAG: DJ-1/PfpI family protein, partial [Planctomycetota bacterium]
MQRPIKILVLLFDCVEVLDFAGPYDVFSMANLAVEGGKPPACGQHGLAYDLSTVSRDGGTVTALHGLRVQADYSFETCPVGEFDVVVVPGSGPDVVRAFVGDRATEAQRDVVDWVAKRCADTRIVASVCVGALFLAKVGALEGRQATTHHGALADLARLAPGAEVLAGARYVHNALDPDAPADEGRHLLLSAGVSAGIDLALYMLRALLGGDSVADATAQIMEFNPTSNGARRIPMRTASARVQPDRKVG